MDNIKEDNEDPMLTYKTFFTIRNHDDTDAISAVAAGDLHIVIKILIISAIYTSLGNRHYRRSPLSNSCSDREYYKEVYSTY